MGGRAESPRCSRRAIAGRGAQTCPSSAPSYKPIVVGAARVSNSIAATAATEESSRRPLAAVGDHGGKMPRGYGRLASRAAGPKSP